MLHQIVSFFAQQCAPTSFFGIPSWYEYLYRAGYVEPVRHNGMTTCEVNLEFVSDRGVLNLEPLGLIFLGALDILLRIGALVAVAFIVYGGIQYVLSQGEPDRAKKAFGTILNGVIGLAIMVIAAAIVAFIGRAVAS